MWNLDEIASLSLQTFLALNVKCLLSKLKNAYAVVTLKFFLQQISTVKEAFIDISLPIIEERVSCYNWMNLENKVCQADDCCMRWF